MTDGPARIPGVETESGRQYFSQQAVQLGALCFACAGQLEYGSVRNRIS